MEVSMLLDQLEICTLPMINIRMENDGITSEKR